MKQKSIAIILSVFTFLGLKSQTNIANYKFASSVGTYVPITGGTTYLTAWDGQISGNIALGGTFTFGGVNYTTCNIYANGYISFGTPGSSFTKPLSNGTFNAVIAAFGQDGSSSAATGASPKIIYKNIGGVSGEFVIQYTDHANFYNKATERLNFQIRLNLATDEVKIVYGSWSSPGSSASSNNAEIGIRGNTTNWITNVNNLVALNTPVGTSCKWDNAVTASSNNGSMLFSQTNTLIKPSTGLTLKWTPPVNAALAPVRFFGSASNIGSTTADLTWIAPTSATQFNIQYRDINSCAWTNFTGNPVTTSSVTLTGLTPSAIYQIRVQSSDGTNNAMWSHIPDLSGTGDGYTNVAGTFSTTASVCVTPPFAGNISGPTTVLDGSNSLYSVAPTVGAIQWYGSFSSQGPWSPITSGTLATNQSIEAIGASTVYYIAVASNLGCDDDTTDTPLQVVIQGTAYCVPAPTSVDGLGITNVNINNGAVNNPSGAEVGNYGNYTSLVANVNQGVYVPVAITFSTGFDYETKIWIDFNNDFDFDDLGEDVYYGLSATTSPNTLVANIYIPLTAPLGNHLMRIGGADTEVPYPCFNEDFGTFEDYTLNVLGAPACTLTPIAGTISGPATVNNASTNTYSISPAAGSLQWYSSSVSSNGPWVAITSATLANQPIVANGDGSVYYTVVAYSPGCTNDTASALLTVITKTAYCVPSPANVDGSGITNVNINSGAINNPSGAEVGNYGNYTSLIASVNQGANMPVAITFSTPTYAYNTKIWIDYNNDFDFDDLGEEVFAGISSTLSPNTLTATIAIAGTAPSGNHIMRIGAAEAEQPTPCFNGFYGTFEDYTINIVTVLCIPAPTIVDGSGIVNVNINNGAVNNPSGAEVGNYGNYSSLVANVNQGVNIPVAITFSTNGFDYNTRIWVDLNNDNDFTGIGEELYLGTSSTVTPNTLNAVVYIPLTATLGNHIMRIGAADFVFPDPCYTDDYGTFEDYTLNVLPAPPCTLTPVAGSISGVSIVSIGTTNTYSIAPSAGSIQWYSSNLATSPWMAIASATTNPLTITATASGTVFYNVVAYSPGCVNDTANVAFMAVVSETTYCVPAPSIVDGDGIINVNVNAGLINNTTTAEVGNYGDYTSLVANVNAGATIPVDVTFSTAGFDYNTKIWIDFNKDFDFDDAGEEVYSGISTTVTPNTLNASILIPSSLLAGNYIMRIGATDEGTPIPCYSDSYGTYEDYSINVTVPTCTPSPSSVDGDGIVNVNINNSQINNSSLAETNNYGNYTSLVANVYQGVNVPVAITFSTDVFDYNTRIWVDFNNDGDFIDAGELLYTGVSALTSPNTLNATISIPFAAALGNHVIRIGAIDTGIPMPCYTGSYGTYEDYTINIQTPPPCTLTPAIGVISGATSSNNGAINSYTVSPAIGNVQWYMSSNSNGPWSIIPSATLATNQTITATGSGIIFYTAVASGLGCVNDTANTPIAVNMVFLGDNVCSAIPLTLGTSPKYNVFGATVEAGEVRPPNTGFQTNTGWGNSNITNTMWFSFVAPASGHVSVQSPLLINGGNNDSQLAIWGASNCTNLIGQATPTAPVGATLIAANDDDINYTANNAAIYSSYAKASCLTPGATYFIQLDTYYAASAGDSTQIVITDLGSFNASFSGLQNLYCLGSASTTLLPATNGGLFTVNNGTASITAFNPNALGTFTVTYSINGCKTESVTSVVNGPTVSITATNNSICGGFSEALSASGASSYTWMPSGNTGAVEIVTPTVTTTYTLLGETSGSCVAQAFFTLTVTTLPAVTISASSTTICPNTTATLTANSSSNLYNWSDGSTTSVITVTPSSSTVYSVTVFNSCGSTTGTININTSNIVSVSAITSNTLLCTGQSAILTANGASSYTWMPMGTISQTVIVAPSSPTTYTLFGASSCGNASSTITQNVSLCTDLASIKDNSEITIYPNPNYGIINVNYPSSLVGSTHFEVYDALGKLVVSEELVNNTTSVSTQHLEAGVYFYHVINNNNRVKIGKIVKQ